VIIMYIVIGLLLVSLGALLAVVTGWVIDYERERRQEPLTRPHWSEQVTVRIPVVEPARYVPRHRRA